MTKSTIGERMTKIETTLEYIKISADTNTQEHKEIIELFTKALDKKADKQEVDHIKRWAYAATGGFITVLIGAIGFLIKQSLF